MRHEQLSCGEVEERLEALVDGELGPAADDVEVHLADCGDCSRAFDLALRVKSELKELPTFDLPAVTIARIKARSEADVDAAARGRSFGRRAWLAAAASLVLVAAAMSWVVSERLSRPGPAEIARAELETRYALAQVARLSRKAGEELRDEVIAGRVADSVRRGLGRSVSSMRSIGTTPQQAAGQGGSES